MHFHFDGVNDAFRGLVKGVHTGVIPTRRSPSRVGDVLQIDEPVIITYAQPTQRVLFNAARDCNPFFHLYEALWMLAGRNDIAPLVWYSSGYAAQVQDGDSPTANGAYGYRWRHAARDYEDQALNRPGIDQLATIADQLKRKPESRRAVLAMWSVEDDLLKIDDSKDVCCNLSACFSIRTEKDAVDSGGVTPWMTGIDVPVEHPLLDMTVFNRSNDLVWGALGANIVHFSMLQEYLAAAIGVAVGVYHQISNNLHVYVDRWKPEQWLTVDREMYYPRVFPLVAQPERFLMEAGLLVEENHSGKGISAGYMEPFLDLVALPMCQAFACHKQRNYRGAISWLERMAECDWKVVAIDWIERRQQTWEAKHESASVE